MESGQLRILFQTLDDVRHQNGQEYWLARELFSLLGYARWEGFEPVIERAKTACQNAGSSVEDHFIELNDEKKDIKLTRYACYLIAVNGDPRKQEIAFAQAYFVTRTRQLEVLQAKMGELERLEARDKLKITEREFGAMAFSRGVDGPQLTAIRSRGDEELFGGHPTRDMKKKLGVPEKQPLADFLPNVTLKAKDLATAMTSENTTRKNLFGWAGIGKEHVENNRNVRSALVKTGIFPEELPPSEDIKKIMSKHKKELKELQTRQEKEIQDALGNNGQVL